MSTLKVYMKTKKERLGEEQLNKQCCLMKIIEYNGATDIIVEFQDEYKAKVHTSYQYFLLGEVKNPYHPSVFGAGIIGIKYPVSKKGKITKEYIAWCSMIKRCFDKNTKNRDLAYEKAICCNEWLLYENFYEWLHKQENFDKWYNGKKWNVDKDILVKGNKIYSPETCCLVPQNVNKLFTKRDRHRGNLPIGVTKHGESYQASCNNPFNNNKNEYLGSYYTPNNAFISYKKYKENVIKKVAKEEYNKNNITKKCYESMMNYEVEIND